MSFCSSSSSENEQKLLEALENERLGKPEIKQTKNMDDFLTLGRYAFFFMLNVELMTLTSLICMVCMVYIGARPKITSCGDVHFLDENMACKLLPELIKNTSCEPKLDYQFLSVNVEYKLFCKEAHVVRNSTSVFMFGVLLGAIIFGQLSDSYGRKITILISLVCISITSLINAYVPSFDLFYYVRILVGIFTGGLSTAMGVYMIENIPKKHRMWISTAITWSPNFIIFPVIAYFCHDWRTLLKANALCAAVSAFCMCFLFESPRFLIQKGRIEEARRIFSKIRRIDGNTKGYDHDELEEMLRHEQTVIENRQKKQRKYTYYHIFCTWEMLTWTITLAFGIASTSLTNYGLMFNMESLIGSLYWNNVFLGIIRWAMNITVGICDYFLEKFGRKLINMLALFFNATCVAWVCYLYLIGDPRGGGWVLRACTIGITAMCSQLYIAKFMACNELYPTTVRNLAVSVLSIWSRIGTMVAPQLFQLAEWDASLPYITILVLTILDLVAFEIFIPETKGTALQNHLPPKEQRIFYRNKKRRQSLVPDGVVN